MRKRHIFKNKLLYYGIGLAILLLIWLIVWVFSHSFLTLVVKPVNAVVTIDNVPKDLSRGGIARKVLSPGEHQIRIEAEGYVGIEKNVKLSRVLWKKIPFALNNVPSVTEVTKDASMLFAPLSRDHVNYLCQEGKAIFRSDFTFDEEGKIVTTQKPLTDAKLSGITEIIWSPSEELALLRKAEGITLFDFKKYDFVHQTETFWGGNIGSVAWAPDNSKIAYYYSPDSATKTLVFSNIAGDQKETILNFADFNISDPLLRWSPDSQWLLIIPRDQDLALNKIFAFNAYTRMLSTLTETGYQIDASFNASSDKIFYMTKLNDLTKKQVYTLSVMNADGNNKKSLDLAASLKRTDWHKKSNFFTTILLGLEGERSVIFSANENNPNLDNTFFYLPDDSPVSRLYLLNEDRVIVYQNESGVYALGINRE